MAGDDEFNLMELIRQVWSVSAELDFNKVAVEVDERIPPEYRDAALRQALPRIVYDVARSGRRQGRIETGENSSTPVNELERKRAARSPKVAGIREYWRQALQETYSVGAGLPSKRLADLTHSDLMFNIGIRETEARRNAAKALELRGLLDLLTRHNAETVGDLPESILAVTLVRSA